MNLVKDIARATKVSLRETGQRGSEPQIRPLSRAAPRICDLQELPLGVPCLGPHLKFKFRNLEGGDTSRSQEEQDGVPSRKWHTVAGERNSSSFFEGVQPSVA
ncbi:hypothetical protein Mapa_009777 [Marchantia paleacea]|nr:hypothetical protein Mapa_009777 [Marchantia paleacea]